MTSPPKNLAASVRQRHYNLHKAGHDDFQRLVVRYAIERLLYRLSQSPYQNRFILKGALLFLVWSNRMHRPTKDLDMLGSGERSTYLLLKTFRALCTLAVEPDGMVYLVDSVLCQEIREDTEYGGPRVTLSAQLGTMVLPLQIDIAFGDVVTPPPAEVEFPVLRDFPPPRLRAYHRETVVAEKLEALVSLGIGNSRMKDFYDLWTLGREFPFDSATLATAIKATFERRGTSLPPDPPFALTTAFAEDAARHAQWQAFRRRLADESGPDLREAIDFLSLFLQPLLTAVTQARSISEVWQPGGPWHTV